MQNSCEGCTHCGFLLSLRHENLFNHLFVIHFGCGDAAGGLYRDAEGEPDGARKTRSDRADSPPHAEYIYPYGDEPGFVTAELTLTFSPGTDLSSVGWEIPHLKYNKSLLVLLTQDDCKQTAFCSTWAAIHGRPLSDTYFYFAAHLRGGDLPPDTYRLGKTLGSTDGTGREVRFAFTTTISPEWAFMDAEASVKPGYTDNYFRFFMKDGLRWGDVAEMLGYGCGIALHDMNTLAVDRPDSILAHYAIAQKLVLDRLAGRGCKMLAEPNGNKNYITAAQSYNPIQTIFLQSGGEKLVPFAVEDDLFKRKIERSFWLPREVPGEIERQLARPVGEREAVNIGVHQTGRDWAELLLSLNDTYGKDGSDCLWMPAPEEYYEYNYLRQHASVTARVEANTVRLKVDLSGGMYFYYPSLTLNIVGVDPAACTRIEGGESVTGLSWGAAEAAEDGAEVLMVNIDCRHALAAHAEHYVELYEKDPTPENRADARYFVDQLKESARKRELSERVK